MRFVIYSDLHLKDSYLNEQLKVLRNIFDFAIENKIENILCLGDFFDKKNYASPRLIKEVLDLFREYRFLFNHYIILGNHDISFINNYEFSNLVYLEDYSFIITEPYFCSLDENVDLYFLPNYKSSVLKKVLDSLKNKINKKKKNILFMHNGIEQLNVGNIYFGYHDASKIDINDLIDFDIVFNGHIHYYGEFKNVVLVNIPLQLNFGDINNDKPGFLVFDTETLEYTRIINDFSPRFIYISYDDYIKRHNEFVNYNVRVIVTNKVQSEEMKKIGVSCVYRPHNENHIILDDIRDIKKLIKTYLENNIQDVNLRNKAIEIVYNSL